MTQICYDARKLHELMTFLRNNQLDIPVLGSVYILNEFAARYLNAGNVPGAVVTDELYARIRTEAAQPDGGKKASLTRAARLMAVMKGLGYRGAHLSGAVPYADVHTIIEMFNEIKGQWRDFLPEFDLPYVGGYYLYKKDTQSGLNLDEPATKSHKSPWAWLNLGLMQIMHWAFFDKQATHYPILHRIAKTIDNNRILKAGMCVPEDIIKTLLFRCQKCGDCALEDVAYFCPVSQCPKFLRNGPCGGSENGRCEVRPERYCVWVRAYQRWKAWNQLHRLQGPCVPPRDWALDKTSSWVNLYMDRDYHGTTRGCCQQQKHIH